MEREVAGKARLALAVIMLATLGSSLAGCAKAQDDGTLIQSSVKRDESPKVVAIDLEAVVAGNTAFAFDLYQFLREQDGNMFYSPYSISVALAMTYAGARGETEQEMARTLHFALAQERLHPAFNALDLDMARRSETVPEIEQEGERLRLHIANSLWGQMGYNFLDEFLDLLALNYGAGMRLVDYANAPEESRLKINQWVSDHTEEKIEDLIPKDLITPATRLVLANAIYFNASWLEPFEEENTHEGIFYLLDGSQVAVPMMSQTTDFRYLDGEGFQAVELPYLGGEMAMVILLPDEGGFEAFEAGLDSERVGTILEGMGSSQVTLAMPKFEFESEFMLGQVLAAMGMPSAFGDADFSGMDGTRNLVIREVVHKAFVSVDETGTEAAAATAVIMFETSAPETPVEMTVDRPFIFMIRDLETGTILFLGRVLNPVG
jgi:serpin B